MASALSAPFGRGKTFFDGGTTNTTDGIHLEGLEFTFEDYDYSTADTKVERSGQQVTCRIVRNSSGITLLPKRLAKFQKSGSYGCRVDGYCATTAEAHLFPIDEWLPSTGVIANDLFYIVVRGPATVLTDIASLGSSTISVGDYLVGLTAATSQATTAGRAYIQDITGATNVLGIQVQNRIGAAMSAATTGQTNAGILCNIGKWI